MDWGGGWNYFCAHINRRNRVSGQVNEHLKKASMNVLRQISKIILTLNMALNMFFIANTNEEDYLKITMTGRKEMFYLTTHSTHFIYSYKASDIW